MNPQILTWLYILLIISFIYWFTVGGRQLFTFSPPIIISIIAMPIVYYMSNQQAIVLMV
jgi:hypothetical protein